MREWRKAGEGSLHVPEGGYLLDLLLEVNPSIYALNRKFKARGLLANNYRTAKSDLRADIRSAMTLPRAFAGPVALDLRFHSECDSDAFLKAVFDALEKSVIENDKQIDELHVKRFRQANVPFIALKMWALQPDVTH